MAGSKRGAHELSQLEGKRRRCGQVFACPHGDWLECRDAECVEMLAAFCGCDFGFVHASPPCQTYARAKHFHGGPSAAQLQADCLADVCDLAVAAAGVVPVSVENVPEARQKMADLCVVTACGRDAALNLNVTRHRVIGFNMQVPPGTCGCTRECHTCGPKSGRPSQQLNLFSVMGNGGGPWGNFPMWLRAMGYDPDTSTQNMQLRTHLDYLRLPKSMWNTPALPLQDATNLSKKGLAQSIPPVYASHFIGPRMPTTKKPCLDLFAGEGGATRGFLAMGLRVIAVDNDPVALSRNPAKWKVYFDAVVLLDRLIMVKKASTTVPSFVLRQMNAMNGPPPRVCVPPMQAMEVAMVT